MTFYVQGLNAHEQMPLDRVLKKSAVEKMDAIIPERAIDEHEHRDHAAEQKYTRSGAKAYQSVSELPQAPGVVVAEKIMSSPVVTLSDQALVADALALFQTKQIRHLPIISSAGELLGMVSERDVLRHLSGVTEDYQQQASRHPSRNERISVLMTSPVLTASADTDVRYIARLFVEQRVGALPIVTDGELKGIIARSDVLSAVMRHFVLELWA